VAVIVVALWVGGELHRLNCQWSGRADCSVLPWRSGKAAGPGLGLELHNLGQRTRELSQQTRRLVEQRQHLSP
jgi:hypothetical protein